MKNTITAKYKITITYCCNIKIFVTESKYTWIYFVSLHPLKVTNRSWSALDLRWRLHRGLLRINSLFPIISEIRLIYTEGRNHKPHSVSHPIAENFVAVSHPFTRIYLRTVSIFSSRRSRRFLLNRSWEGWKFRRKSLVVYSLSTHASISRAFEFNKDLWR